MIEVGFSIVAFIVAIGVLVSVHEFGHFWVARRLGFKVLRFSVGFGRPLVRWRGSEGKRGSWPQRIALSDPSADASASSATEYWLSAIPLGGYVKLLDEREAPVSPEERHLAFNRRPVSHRVAVLAAGPAFNFLFAVLAYWAMFVSGVTGTKAIVGAVTPGSVAAQAGLVADAEILAVGDQETQTWNSAILAILDDMLADGRIDLLVRTRAGDARRVRLDVSGREAELTEPGALFTGLGFEPGPLIPAVTGELTPGAAAERAGFRPGDRVVSADGEPIVSWWQWVEYVRARPGETVSILVERDGGETELDLQIEAVEDGDVVIGRIGAAMDVELAQGIMAAARTDQRYGLLEALPRGLMKTWEMSELTVRMLGRMLTGDVSVRNISGPINIAAYAGDSARQGLSSFLSFLSVVSISLGILNLLPVPLLDGGQIVYQLVEFVKGSPLSERTMIVGQQFGIMLLIVLMSFAFYNDLSRMFG